MKHKIIIWGAGKIGRGFIADLFYSSGYRVVFVDESKQLINALNKEGKYTVLRYRSDTDKESAIVSGYTALHTSQKQEISSEVLSCRYMAIALFPGAFEQMASEFACLVKHRIESGVDEPLDTIVCANIPEPSRKFKEYLLPLLNREEKVYFKKYIGLIDSLVIRMAVQPTKEMTDEDPLVVLTNGYEELTLDETAFKGTKLSFSGIVLTKNIHAEEVRKMFTYNMVHALYAFLGYQKGYEYIEQCTKDEEIQRIAKGALDEVAQALIKQFSFTDVDMRKWNARVLSNMANPILKDKISRVGGDPIRKLKKGDRLTGSAILCKDNGVMPYFITKAIANAFLFDNMADNNAVIASEYAVYYGVKPAAVKYCGLEKEPELLHMIETHYKNTKLRLPEDFDKAVLMKKAYGMGFEFEKVYKGCAQCTLLAFFELVGNEDEALFQSASGFSGGMAISGDGVCGGYSGGIMAMGSIVGRRLKHMKEHGDKQAQYKSYVMAQELRDRFIQTYGSVVCSDIHIDIFGKSYCLRTKAVRSEFEEDGAHLNKCTNVVGMASAWLAEILYNHGYLDV